MTTNTELVSMADIARMAGVSRAVVGNWKRRHADTFPKERTRSRQGPLYDAVEVAAWLANRGQPDGSAGTATELTNVYWDAADRFRGDLMLHDIGAGLLYAIARQLADRLGQGERFRADIAALDDSLPAIANRMQEIAPTFLNDILSRVSTESTAGDLALTIATTPITRHDSTTPQAVADLVAHIVSEPDVVFDPAVGTGSLAATVARRAQGPARVVGQDVNPRSTALATCTALACGLDADIRLGDSLVNDSFRDLLADTVVFSPPFGVRLAEPLDPDDARWQFGDPGRFAELAWIQAGLHHLAPGGTMVCLTLPGFLFRSGRDRRILQGLVRANRLRAVIALPNRALESIAIAPVVLVFGSPPQTGSPAPAPILMVDSPTWLEHQAGSTQFDRTSASDIGDHVRAWLESGELPEQRPGVALASFDDIVANDWVLTPTRYQPRQPAVAVPPEFVDACRADANQQGREIAELIGEITEQSLLELAPAAAMRPLGKIAGVAVLPGIRPRVGGPEPETSTSTSSASSVIVSVRDLALGETPRIAPPDVQGNRITDLDILITVGGHGIGATYFCEPAAPVDAFPAQMTVIIRVDRDVEVTPHYLAAWLSHPDVRGELERLAVGSGLPRLRIDDLQSMVVPIPDREAQQRFADRWMQLRNLKRRQRVLTEALEHLDGTEMSFLRAQLTSGGGR